MKEKIYLENVVDVLRDFADKEYQIKVWLNVNNTENLVGSFYESASMLFDDCIIGDLLKEGEVIISKDVTKILYEISDIIDNIDTIDGYRDEEEIIDDLEMQLLREKAAQALELIKATDGSESTVDFVKVGTADEEISIKDIAF